MRTAEYSNAIKKILLSTHPYCCSGELESHTPATPFSLGLSPTHSVKEAYARIKEVCDVGRKLIQVRYSLKSHSYKFRKMGQVPDRQDLYYRSNGLLT